MKEFHSTPQRLLGVYDDENLTESIAWAEGRRVGSGLLVAVTSIDLVDIVSGTAFNF